MLFYAAPMEGITGFVFRNAHAAVFGGADAYISPFLTACATHSFQEKEVRDIAPDNNDTICLIPQVLGKSPEDVSDAIRRIAEYGYSEVDLNLGCPSRTVTAKGKGGALLRDPDTLDRFLSTIFGITERDGIKISAKTRIGYDRPEEARALCRVFFRYPFSRLTVHARVTKAMYEGKADVETFRVFYESRTCPLIYNGDLAAPDDIRSMKEAFPELDGVMAGRGLITDPALFRRAKGGKEAEAEEILDFHRRLISGYRALYNEDRIVLGRMKELWVYLGKRYPSCDRQKKRLAKCASLPEFRIQAESMILS